LIVIAYFGWRWFAAWRARRAAQRRMAEGAHVVDVRSREEFAAAHAAGSLNVPLGELSTTPLPWAPDQWVVVCCASGTRSAIGTRMLRRRGFTRVLNGGSWRNLVSPATR
jgi:rhodanese-related sulfurtransferase